MRAFIPFLAVMMFGFISCKKDSSLSQKENPGILGKWNVITDSSFAGVSAGSHPLYYTGREGDYFNFSSEGRLYVKENNIVNTYNYVSTLPATLIIDLFGISINGVPDTTTITYETPHTIIVNTPFIMTPGGTFGRKVHLWR